MTKGDLFWDDQGKPRKIRVELERPRVFTAVVFNAQQMDGVPPLEIKEQIWDASQRAENILKGSGARISHDQANRAFYRPSTDRIHLPPRSQFPTADNYYATALHELGHWTGHPSRLSRDLSHPFGSEMYAKEELRAEIASYMLGAELNIGHDPGQHVAYVKSWIKTLKDDPFEIMRASSDAEKIQRYVLSMEQEQEQGQDAALVAYEREVMGYLSADIQVVLNDPDLTFDHFHDFQGGETLEAALRHHGLQTVGDVTGPQVVNFPEEAWSSLAPVFGMPDSIEDQRETTNAYLEAKGLMQAFSDHADRLLQQGLEKKAKETGYAETLQGAMREKYDQYQGILAACYGRSDPELMLHRNLFQDEPLAFVIADEVARMEGWEHTPGGLVNLMIRAVENRTNHRLPSHDWESQPLGNDVRDASLRVISIKDTHQPHSPVVMKITCTFNHVLETAEPVSLARSPDMKVLSVAKGEISAEEVMSALQKSFGQVYMQAVPELKEGLERQAKACTRQLPERYRVSLTPEGGYQLQNPESVVMAVHGEAVSFSLQAVRETAEQDSQQRLQEHAFLQQADEWLTKAYGITLADTNEEKARGYFQEKSSPEAFVQDWAEKYDLDPVDNEQAERLRMVAQTIEQQQTPKAAERGIP